MEMDAVLTLYRVRTLDDIDGLKEDIAELESKVKISISQCKVPAFVGELAGTAMDILVSEPVKALLAAAGVGRILWSIVRRVKNAGKSLRIGKELVRLMLAAKVCDEVSLETGLDDCRVWGPMEAEPLSGIIADSLDDWDGATSPVAYFMCIVVPVPRKRVRTLWYLLGSGGVLYGSWKTQTLRERVPEFLRPDE